MRLVVEGPTVAGRPPSQGPVACQVRESGKVDLRKREGKARDKGKGGGTEILYHWDFVLLRADGTTVFLRPTMNTTYVEYYERQLAAGICPNFSPLPCPDVSSIQDYADTALYDNVEIGRWRHVDIDWQMECMWRESGVQRIHFLKQKAGDRGEGLRRCAIAELLATP